MRTASVSPYRAWPKQILTMASLSCWLIIFVNAMPFAPALAEPINIGTAKQVFIDGRFFKSSHNVELVVNRPRVTGEALLVAEHP